MKTETFKGTVENAYGKALPKPVSVEGSFEAFESMAEVRTAKEELSDDEELQVINGKRKAAARAAATTAALSAAGYEKPDPNSPEVIRENQIKGIMKLHNISREKAEQAYKLMVEAITA